jgi:predicted RNA-binding protein
MSYWLVVGSKQNWETAFQQKNIWGLRTTQRYLWESIEEIKDKLLFYCTSPIGGVIGHGIVKIKFLQNKPLWPEEIQKNTVIWPLRFEFDVEFCFPQDKWNNSKITSSKLFPRAGFQSIEESEALHIISEMHKNEYTIPELKIPQIKESGQDFIATVEKTDKNFYTHSHLQERLLQVGKLQDFIAEKEYPFDTGKLDVVWRRVINSVPTYVFEIQIGGDIYHALGKLKHAYDLWNSNIYFIASEKDYAKANTLLTGTFHEIGDRLKHIEIEKVEELYQRKKAYFDLEKMLGI